MLLDALHNQVGRRHCGLFTRPLTVDILGNAAIIVFRSDRSNHKRGFLITYRAYVSILKSIFRHRYWWKLSGYAPIVESCLSERFNSRRHEVKKKFTPRHKGWGGLNLTPLYFQQNLPVWRVISVLCTFN